MKRLMIGLLACAAVLRAAAADSEWLTDFAKAKETARAEKKLVLMDFTGSDWCGWCIKFKKETLDTPEFKEFAKKNLVLVELDYPSKKQLPEALKKQNDGLKKEFKVSGFPTLVVLDSSGKEIGRQVGYLKGGPQAFIDKINGFKK